MKRMCMEWGGHIFTLEEPGSHPLARIKFSTTRRQTTWGPVKTCDLSLITRKYQKIQVKGTPQKSLPT